MKVTDALEELYKVLDPRIKKGIDGRNISCKKGCSACCALYVCTSIANGIAIAEHLARKPDWKDWIPRLADAAKEMMQPGVDKVSWWKKNIPCIFLKDDLCSIYEVRPVECRYYFVSSPVEFCGNDNPGYFHVHYDTLKEQAQVWKLSDQVHKEMPDIFGPSCCAPLPIMILYGFKAIFQKSRRRRQMIENVLKKLPLPHVWFEDQVKQAIFAKRGFNANECQCKDEAGQPLNKCDECPR